MSGSGSLSVASSSATVGQASFPNPVTTAVGAAPAAASSIPSATSSTVQSPPSTSITGTGVGVTGTTASSLAPKKAATTTTTGTGTGTATATTVKRKKTAATADASTNADGRLKGKPPRKKKANNSTTKPSAASAAATIAAGGSSSTAAAMSRQQLVVDALQASTNLAQHRALNEARKTDPLWYKMEDVLPSIHDPNSMVGKTSVLPEQLQVIDNVLRQTGLTRSDLTPQAMACLIEQARRFTLELLTDAQDYAMASASSSVSPEISEADLLLATEMRVDHPVSVLTQLPRLNIVANRVNRAPLPPIPAHCYSGVLLPVAEHQISGRSYDIIHAGQVARRMVQQPPSLINNNNTGNHINSKKPNNNHTNNNAVFSTGIPARSPSSMASGNVTSATAAVSSSSHGATRGRQIQVKIKTDSAAAASSSGINTSNSTPTSAQTTILSTTRHTDG